MKSILGKIEEYQEITGLECDNLDRLKLHVKCFYIKSKYLNEQDKILISKDICRMLKSEFIFCELTTNYDAIDILTEIKSKLSLV